MRWTYFFTCVCNVSSCLQQCKNYKNRVCFSRVMITNVLPSFFSGHSVQRPGWRHCGPTETVLKADIGILYVKLIDLVLGWVTTFNHLDMQLVTEANRPPTIRGMRNEYQPNGGDAQRQGSKGTCGSLHLCINV